jgi:UDP-glucose 4-epimerase
LATFLVTGIAGFIGSSIARELIRNGQNVRGIDNFATGNRDNLLGIQDLISFWQADINDPVAIAEASAGADYVLHQAAIPSVPKSVADPAASNRANVDGTLSVLIAARDAKVKRFVYAASSSAYGNAPSLPKHEAMMSRPISPYAVAKYTGELYCQSFYQVYGLQTVSLRYFNVFGPRQDPSSPYSGVLSRFITQMLNGESPIVFGDGEQTRDFTYIENVVAANLLATTAPADKVAGKMFNVALGERTSLNDVLATLREITGYRGEVRYEPERVGDVRDSLADITAARNALGYTPTVSFQDGLRRTVEWYKSVLIRNSSASALSASYLSQ